MQELTHAMSQCTHGGQRAACSSQLLSLYQLSLRDQTQVGHQIWPQVPLSTEIPYR